MSDTNYYVCIGGGMTPVQIARVLTLAIEDSGKRILRINKTRNIIGEARETLYKFIKTTKHLRVIECPSLLSWSLAVGIISALKHNCYVHTLHIHAPFLRSPIAGYEWPVECLMDYNRNITSLNLRYAFQKRPVVHDIPVLIWLEKNQMRRQFKKDLLLSLRRWSRRKRLPDEMEQLVFGYFMRGRDGDLLGLL